MKSTGVPAAAGESEGLCSSYPLTWRKAAREGSLRKLAKQRGPTPSARKRDVKRLRRLDRENARLREELRKARIVIEVQGKVSGLGRSIGGGQVLLSAVGRACRARGRESRVQGAAGCALDVLPSPEVEEDRAAAAPRPTPARAVSEAERNEVFEVLCSERFADRAPAEVYATLLDEGVYLCSERTMYRILAENQAVREHRAHRSHPNHPKPELLARAPNELWSWDVTRLLGPRKGQYFYLYVILDIFSRHVTGWMVAERETAGLAGRLIEESCLKHGVRPQVLTLHSRRGSPMTAECTAQLMADLGVTQSPSRPRVSNDNPYSEAQSRPSSTIPASRADSPTSRRQRSSAAGSSRGTTPSTVMAASACSRPSRSTLGRAPEVIQAKAGCSRRRLCHPSGALRAAPGFGTPPTPRPRSCR